MIGPTIVTVPCFSGAPWHLEELTPLAGRPLRTMRLPDNVDDIDAYADFVEGQVADLDDYILVGDSFGAVVSLALAVRRPRRLRGLVLSGGFAANPVDSPLLRAKVGAARFLPGPLYRQVTLRFHAAALADNAVVLMAGPQQGNPGLQQLHPTFPRRGGLGLYIRNSAASFCSVTIDR